jgi:hypothetical protein
MPARASVTVMKLGVGGSIWIMAPARYWGVWRSATTKPRARPTRPRATMKTRLRQTMPA